MPTQIRFDDGAAYERYMGRWSQLAGDAFLDWMAPPAGWRWLDVGCGNGAFTEMLVERCAPASVEGIDPSEEQLAFARTRPASRIARFRQGDAMALPFPDDTFDAAVMPLVIFFVPDPAKGVAEMARVVGPGGLVSAYAWDMPGGGLPYEALQEEARGLGAVVPMPPRPDASRIDMVQELWSGAGLQAVETHVITVHRTFADFDDYWTTILGGPSVRATFAAMTPDQIAALNTRMRARLPADGAGHITCRARANAVKGLVPRQVAGAWRDNVTDSRMRFIAAPGLVVGALLGMAGTFASSASLRGLAWGIDGTALIVATALLAIHHIRRGNDAVAAGFLIFAIGEALIVSGSAMDVVAAAPSFGAGVALWAASLAIVSAFSSMPAAIRGVGFVASFLFAAAAVQIFMGQPLTALSRPLPFFAYPFLAFTLFGWAWVHYRRDG